MLCDRVSAAAPSILEDTPTSESESTERLFTAVFKELCEYLHLQPAQQRRALDGPVGFLVLQTLEEHMEPEFSYTGIIDAHLLNNLRRER